MKVVFKDMAIEKIRHWVNECDYEVSGMGLLTIDKENKVFTVTDAFLLKQVGGAAHTNIDSAAISELMDETAMMEGHLNFWWHSHVNMAAFWSGTDRQTITDLGKEGLCVATVFNKKGEHLTAVEYAVDGLFGKTTHFTDKVVTEFESFDPWHEYRNLWSIELKNKVKEQEYGYMGNVGYARNIGVVRNDGVTHWQIPQYVEREAKLIGMDPLKLWEIYTTGSKEQIEELDRKISSAEAKQWNMYSDWGRYE